MIVGLSAVLVAAAFADDETVEPTELDKALDRVSRQASDTAEPVCQTLLKEYTSPEEHGRICHALTRVYAHTEFCRAPKKVLEWAQRGLECPLDPKARQEMYMWWANGVMYTHKVWGARDDARQEAMRREAVVPLLRALKALAEHDLPDGRPERPIWVKERNYYEKGTPEHEASEAKYKAQLEAHWRVRFLEDMVSWRDRQEREIAGMYTFPKLPGPAMLEELLTLAKEELQDEQAIEHLLSAVRFRAVNAQNAEIHRGAATQPADDAPDHGVRLLLTTPKTRWEEDEFPMWTSSFEVRISNEGKDSHIAWPTQATWAIVLNDAYFSYFAIGSHDAKPLALEPGAHHDVSISLDAYWSRSAPGGGKPIFAPGLYTLRVICPTYTNVDGKPDLFSRVEVYSNVIEFEIVPAKKKPQATSHKPQGIRCSVVTSHDPDCYDVS